MFAKEDRNQGIGANINEAKANRDDLIAQRKSNHIKITELKDSSLEKDDELQRYRLVTAKYAMWISFIFGLVISLVGVRILQNLVEVEIREGLQFLLFDVTDIILTGGTIAGGSAAIDKIGKAISNNFGMKNAQGANN